MKAIITDLDRTLLKTDKSVSEKTISVLNAAHENGVKAMFEAFGIDPKDAVYFGDDNDDIESLKWCGKGVDL
ncbi:MAG: HAD hydrolase family protein [Treponema sp.]|nr:HAD hydrolase family protein [Treponema sp.]